MPKTAYDFSKEMLFYMIKCNDESVDGIYIGSTFDFTKRKSAHKSCCNNEKDPHYHFKIYQTIRANGGWDNYNINVIDRKVVIDKLEARQHEQTLIEKHAAKLNSIKAFGNNKEYVKEYYETHTEEINAKHREYDETHKEQRKEYNKNHREHINAYMREYRKKKASLIIVS